MKRLFISTLILLGLLLSANAQASLWNWACDDCDHGPISGTLMTSEMGYGAQKYSVTTFELIDNGGTSLPTGIYDVTGGPSFTPLIFDWTGSAAMNFFNDDGAGSGWNLDRSTVGFHGFLEIQASGSLIWQLFEISSDIFPIGDGTGTFEITPVPIPAAAWLFMTGLIGLVWKGRKRASLLRK